MKNRLEEQIEQLKQDLVQSFKSGYLHKRVVNEQNIASLQSGINKLLDNYRAEYAMPLEPVRVTQNSDYCVTVDLLSAFKKFPKYIQKEIACQIADVNPEDVQSYEWSPEGYITGLKMKGFISHIVIPIDVE